MPHGGVRTKLAAYVREQALWRESVVEQDVSDRRSRRSAARLWALADHIETLRADDRRLAALARVYAQRPQDEFTLGGEGRYLISRFAFDSSDADQDLDEFLNKLVRAVVAEDRRDQERQLDDQLASRDVDALLDEFDSEAT